MINYHIDFLKLILWTDIKLDPDAIKFSKKLPGSFRTEYPNC